MNRRRSDDALGIEELRSRFENWRQSRSNKARIPDELWSAAIEIARRDGVNRTAAALHLDGGKLKRLMTAGGAAGSGKVMSPTFVELVNPSVAGVPECTIELEGQNGKLRIHWKGATVAEVAGLSRALWNAVVS